MIDRRGRRQEAISAILRPQSVAVIGASATGVGSGAWALKNLASAGTGMTLTVVHPSADSVLGVPAVPDVSQLPPIDCALVSLPAAAVLATLEKLDAHGVRSAVVPSAGFAPEVLEDLRAFCASSDLVVHGPNCMGLLNFSDGVLPWFYEDILTSFERGPVSLITQSGSAAFLLRGMEATGVSKIISTGNEIDVSTSDYLRWLADDPDTTTIGLVMESLVDVDGFIEAVSTVRGRGKRIVALKVGRTGVGAAAAKAHTGALAGGDAGYVSLFERLDVPLVNDYDELAVALQVLAAPQMPLAAGRSVGIVTDSGGEAGLSADISTRTSVRLAALSAETLVALEKVNPGVPLGNPLDAGASTAWSDDRYESSYRLVAQDADVDALLVLVEAHVTLSKGEVEYAEDICAALNAVRRSCPDTPVIAVSSSSLGTHPRFRSMLDPSVPLVRGIANAFAAVAALAANKKPIEARPQRPHYLPDKEQVGHLRERFVSDGDGPALRSDLLRAYGLPVVSSVAAWNDAEAIAWAQGRFPVVAKVVSSDIAHRSDVGGVVLGIDNANGLTVALEQIRRSVAAHAPTASIQGFEVQQQVVGAGLEGLLGFTADPVFGAVIVLGSGGTLVELDSDVVGAVAPITQAEAVSMVSRTRLGARLAGYRNLIAETDLTHFADCAVRLSWLAHDLNDVLAAVDLNPAIIDEGTGAVSIVDALLVPQAHLDTPRAVSAALQLETA